MIIAGERVDIEYFKANLNDKDFEEFKELIPFIDIIKSTKTDELFQKVFDKVDTYKNELYSMPLASSFRAQKGSDIDEAEQKLNQLFDEEFGDE